MALELSYTHSVFFFDQLCPMYRSRLACSFLFIILPRILLRRHDDIKRIGAGIVPGLSDAVISFSSFFRNR